MLQTVEPKKTSFVVGYRFTPDDMLRLASAMSGTPYDEYQELANIDDGLPLADVKARLEY